MTLTMDSQQAYKHVLEGYSAAALASSSTTAYADRVAKAFGYSPAELADIPAGANMGLSCGNPTALAGIKEVCLRMRFNAQLHLPIHEIHP